MLIQLQPPYDKLWRKGYLVTNPEGRRTVILFNTHRDRSSTSYARYLMSVHLGRLLGRHEHVDHIDNDKTNDVVDNLQLLSQAENSRKAAKPRTVKQYVCPTCGITFSRRDGLVHTAEPSCSRGCARKRARKT